MSLPGMSLRSSARHSFGGGPAFQNKGLYDALLYTRVIKGNEHKFEVVRDASIPEFLEVVSGGYWSCYPYRENLYMRKDCWYRNGGSLAHWTRPPDFSTKDLSFYSRYGSKVQVSISPAPKDRFRDMKNLFSSKTDNISVNELQAHFNTEFDKRAVSMGCINNHLAELDVMQLDAFPQMKPPPFVDDFDLPYNVDNYNLRRTLVDCEIHRSVHASSKGDFTFFHLDLSGGCPVYQVVEGRKIFWLVKPTDANTNHLFDYNNDKIDFRELINRFDSIFEVVLEPGDLLHFTCMHAVYTAEDSIVITNTPLFMSDMPYQNFVLDRFGPKGLQAFETHEEMIVTVAPFILGQMLCMLYVSHDTLILAPILQAFIKLLRRSRTKINDEPGKRFAPHKSFLKNPSKISSIDHNLLFLESLLAKLDEICQELASNVPEGFENTVFGLPASVHELGSCSEAAIDALYRFQPFPTMGLFDEFNDINSHIYPSLSVPLDKSAKEDILRYPAVGTEKACCLGKGGNCRVHSCRSNKHVDITLSRWSLADVRLKLETTRWSIRSHALIKSGSWISLACGRMILRGSGYAVLDSWVPLVTTNPDFRHDEVYFSFEHRTSFVGLLKRTPHFHESNCHLKPMSVGGRLCGILVARTDIRKGVELIMLGPPIADKLSFAAPRDDPDRIVADVGVLLRQSDIVSLSPDAVMTNRMIVFLIHDLVRRFGPYAGNIKHVINEDWNDFSGLQPDDGNEVNYFVYFVCEGEFMGTALLVCLTTYQNIVPNAFSKLDVDKFCVPYFVFIDVFGAVDEKFYADVCSRGINYFKDVLPEEKSKIGIKKLAVDSGEDLVEKDPLVMINEFSKLFLKDAARTRHDVYDELIDKFAQGENGVYFPLISKFRRARESKVTKKKESPDQKRKRAKAQNVLEPIGGSADAEEPPSIVIHDISPGGPRYSPDSPELMEVEDSSMNTGGRLALPTTQLKSPPRDKDHGPIQVGQLLDSPLGRPEMVITTRRRSGDQQEVLIPAYVPQPRLTSRLGPDALRRQDHFIKELTGPQSSMIRRLIGMGIGLPTQRIALENKQFLVPRVNRAVGSAIRELNYIVRGAEKASRIVFHLTDRAGGLAHVVRDSRNWFLPIVDVIHSLNGIEAEEEFLSIMDAKAAFSETCSDFMEGKQCVTCNEQKVDRFPHHLETHLKERQFRCFGPECRGKSFPAEFHLKRHFKSKVGTGHQNYAEQPQAPVSRAEFTDYLGTSGWTLEEGKSPKWRYRGQLRSDRGLLPLKALIAEFLFGMSTQSRVRMQAGGGHAQSGWNPNPEQRIPAHLIHVLYASHYARDLVTRSYDNSPPPKPSSADLVIQYKHVFNYTVNLPLEFLKGEVSFRHPDALLAFCAAVDTSGANPVQASGAEAADQVTCAICGLVGGYDLIYSDHSTCQQI